MTILVHRSVCNSYPVKGLHRDDMMSLTVLSHKFHNKKFREK